jgi:hypothetical protein
MCNVASCWIYIGILLGAHPILHISRIRVNEMRVAEETPEFYEIKMLSSSSLQPSTESHPKPP